MVWERLTAPDRYFYPRPPRGERRCGLAKSALPRVISIHALREESDLWPVTDDPHPTENISIHALREESDAAGGCLISLREKFLSTPSARRATRLGLRPQHCAQYFYPRPPRGERPKQKDKAGQLWHYFYPRPPRGERPRLSLLTVTGQGFLSTPSARRATRRQLHPQKPPKNFYPRPPRGERQQRKNYGR